MDKKDLVSKLKNELGLEPLPQEGGFYRETYRSELKLPADVLPSLYQSPRSASTAIYYLLTPDTCSALHKLPGDEVYHFYLGDPVELLQLYPDGTGEVIVLGERIFDGMKLQAVVPGGTYQGARLKEGGSYALLGTTMAPGFEFEDFRPGDVSRLSDRYPEYAELITALNGP